MPKKKKYDDAPKLKIDEEKVEKKTEPEPVEIPKKGYVLTKDLNRSFRKGMEVPYEKYILLKNAGFGFLFEQVRIMGTFIQKETISMSGAAKEEEITLNRGREQAIREIRATFANSSAGDYLQFFRKDSETTADERDDSHADSKGVLYGEGYFGNGDLVLSSGNTAAGRGNDSRGAKLRVRVNSTQVGTVYLNVVYDYI